MTPADVRDRLIEALRQDLVGPALPDELLDQAPTRWYLTGFLAPLNASHDQRGDPDANDEADLLEPALPAAEDNASPDRPTARNSLFPASLGLSVLVGAETRELTVQLDWGDYVWVRLMIFKNLIRYTEGAILPALEEPIMPRRQLVLSETERRELVPLRDHARQPYQRERAAALLKIADGMPAALVARHGLLRPRRPDTVYAWLDRYQATGDAGLKVHHGRGRKPAFSPSACEGGGGPHRIATPLPV